MNITFDESLKKDVWDLISDKAKNHACPFCGSEITSENFAGAAFIKDEFRVFDGNILCLIAFSDVMEALQEFGDEDFVS